MRNAVTILWISCLLLIGLNTSWAQVSSSVSYRISVTLPPHVAVNQKINEQSLETLSSAKNPFEIQYERINRGPESILLKTVTAR